MQFANCKITVVIISCDFMMIYPKQNVLGDFKDILCQAYIYSACYYH